MALQPSREQRVAIKRFVNNVTYGCFDPVGFGKTAVAINAAIETNNFPCLVTVPSHLAEQWRDELQLWGVPSSEIAVFNKDTEAEERSRALTGYGSFNIVSYDTWSRYPEWLVDRDFKCYVFDEFHRVRKAKGVTWKQISRLRTKTRSKHRSTALWSLTGTPLVRDPADIFPFLYLCEPDRWRYNARLKFAKDWCHTFQGEYSLKIGKVRDPDAFYELLGRHSIRRRWKDVPELAKLQRRDVDVPVVLPPDVRRRQQGIKEHWRDPVTNEPIVSSGQMAHALRRLSVPTKVKAASELVQDHSGRWLLLAWYRDTARQVYQAVQQVAGDRTVSYIDGGTNASERNRACRRYRDGGILVGTIGASSEGLNLQAGSQIALIEKHYLPATNDQAIGRVLRRGQTQPVLVHEIYARGSFDVKIRRMTAKRQANIDHALREYLEEL